MASHDILLPYAGVPARTRAVAFVPITLAVCGIAAILFGGIRADVPRDAFAAASAIDPVTTGSIALPVDRQKALRHLDD
jgi:hypothetical protein